MAVTGRDEHDRASRSTSIDGDRYDGLAHITDWVPTLIAGVLDRADLLGIDECDDDNVGGAAADDDDDDGADHGAAPARARRQRRTSAAAAASSSSSSSVVLDGVDLWAALRGEGLANPRQEVLLNSKCLWMTVTF